MNAWQLHGGGFTTSHSSQGKLLRPLLPVFAVELGYIDFFFLIPPFPLGGKWSPSRLPETPSRR